MLTKMDSLILVYSCMYYLSSMLSVTWTFPFLLLRYIGICYCELTDAPAKNMLNNLNSYSTIIRNSNPSGIVIGWPYIGYATTEKFSSVYILYMITTESFYKRKWAELNTILCSNNVTELTKSTEKPTKQQTISVMCKSGRYDYPDYSVKNLVLYYDPLPSQQKIIEEIMDLYTSKLVILLHGPKGVGKSMIPLLLAKRMVASGVQPSYTDEYNPTEPNSDISKLYSECKPSKQRPLILVLEEIDIMIQAIHDGNVYKHMNLRSTISDKSTWCKFFDHIERGYYPWMIVFMTTNRSPKFINDMDESYIRSGRIDKIYEMDKPLDSVWKKMD